MKKTLKFVGITVLAAVIGFSFVACSGGGAGGGGNYSGKPGGQQPVNPLKETYVSYDADGNMYELVITEATAAKAAMFRALDQNKDYTYTLTITFVNGTKATSTGTVAINIDTETGAIVSIDLKHTTGTTIKVTVSGSEESDTGGFAIEAVTDKENKPVDNIPVDNDSEVKEVDVPKGSYILNEAGTGYILVKGVVTNGAAVIPATFLGKPVTEIGWRAFAYNTDLTSVTFAPNSQLKTIEAEAFYSCTSLTGVTIPSGVTSIGWRAFAITNITNITIPSSVTFIDGQAFSECTSLTSIIIPDSVTYIGPWTFEECINLTSVTLRAGITSIPDGMFMRCTRLSDVTIPDSVTSIGNMAFLTCESLTSINIPEGVTTIGVRGTSWGGTFSECTSITEITIPSNVTYIHKGAFAGWTDQQTVYIEGYESHEAASADWDEGWDWTDAVIIYGLGVPEPPVPPPAVPQGQG